MSDERFARQYRFELPSRFPSTSLCTSIVHHLSGPNIRALVREKHTTREATDKTRSNAIWVTCALGFDTRILAHILDSLVRVSRRVGSEGWPKPGTKTSSHDRVLAERTVKSEDSSRSPEYSKRRTVPKPTDSLASNDFAYCLTLSPKCFSSFPHGTCSLSVSRQYLALEGYHLPLHAPFPRNATR